MPNPPPKLPPQPVDYARPNAYSYRPRVLSARIAIHVWAMALAIWAGSVLAIPKLAEVMKDFKVEMPLITRITLGFSQLLRTPPGLLLGLLVAIALPFALTAVLSARYPDPDQYRRREIWTAWLLRFGALLVFAWVALSIFLPYAALIQSVSNISGKK